MTLSEAYEELLKIHQQKDSAPQVTECCEESYGTHRCKLTLGSGWSVFQQSLAECQRSCLAEF